MTVPELVLYLSSAENQQASLRDIINNERVSRNAIVRSALNGKRQGEIAWLGTSDDGSMIVGLPQAETAPETVTE